MRNSSGPFGPENGHDSISSNNSGNGSNRIHGNSNNISPRLGGMRGRADIRNDYRLVAIRVGQYRFQNNSNFNMGRSRASWQGSARDSLLQNATAILRTRYGLGPGRTLMLRCQK